MSFPNSRQLVLNLANRDNPPPQGLPSPNFTDVTFDPVTVLPVGHSSGREVSVLIRSLQSGRFRNNRIVYYDRYILSSFFGEYGEIPYVANATPQLIINSINTRYGLSFSTDEFTITEFEDETYDGTQVTLVANEDNYAYRGTKVFAIVNEGLIPLESVIVNQILNGLVYPEVIELNVVESNDYALTGDLVEGDGDLLGGYDLTAEGFVSSATPELLLALSVAPLGSDVEVPLEEMEPGNFVKRIEMNTSDSDWSFIFAAQLQGDRAGLKITDYYDIELSATNTNTNETLNMILIDSVVNENSLDWRIVFNGQAHENGNDITNNGLTETLDAILTVQRLSYYRENVMPNTDYISTPPQAALGSFTFVMTAYRKDSVVAPLTVSLNVSVSSTL